MELITLLFCLVLIVYAVFITALIIGFDLVNNFRAKDLYPKTTFSIVVPFRNEENNFLNLLQSISGLNYPKNLFEIIVVNDSSDDNSEIIFENWKTKNQLIQSRLLQNNRVSNSPKKDAIATAIATVKNQWIITTDADCVVNQNWLLCYDNLIQSCNAEMVVGSVCIANSNGFLNYFQFVDLLSLQGTTIGSFGLKKPFMCNGANFAYTKKLFLELNGFDGNNKIASGDDVFLLQKAFRNFPEKVFYLKNPEAIVRTNPENSWSKLFFQRVRWASKTSFYDGFFGKTLAVVVLLMNIFWLLAFGFCVFGSWVFCFGLLTKMAIDYILLWKTNKFMGNRKFFFPFVSSLVYPVFCSVVGIYSLFGGFSWKDRSFRK
jgi:glycosyltransferase involved in cell wall biosynthesis